MSNNLDFLYYCDSYPAIGMGHLKRGIDIVRELLKQEPELQVAMAGHFSDSAWSFLQKLKPKAVPSFRDELPPKKVKLAMLDTINPGDASTIPLKKAQKIKSISNRLFTINTGFETYIPDCIDGIINYIPIAKYSGNIDVKKYLGVEFAPVSPEFTPKKWKTNRHIVCIIGGNQDQYGPKKLSEKLVENLPPEYTIDFILSPHFPEKKRQQLQHNYPKINFYQNLESIAEYMRRAQAVITTYGNATWEALTLHRPVFIVSYLEFQKRFAEYLAEQEYAVDLGYFENLATDKMGLLTKIDFQKARIEKLKGEFQKPGIINIANKIREEIHVS